MENNINIFRNPQHCLEYTELLIEHFNGHIRYGAAIALAISCAGTGYKVRLASITFALLGF